MKRILLALLIIFIICGFGYSYPETNTKIEKVTVFIDSALINRSGKINITKGENLFIIKGLTTNVIDNTIQASIDKNIGKIVDVKVEKSYTSAANEEKINLLLQQIKEVENKIKMLGHEKKATENFIDIIGKSNPLSASLKLTAAELQNYSNFLENSLKKSYKDLAKIETEISTLNEEKDKLKNELSNIGGQNKESKNIILTVKGFKTAESKIELSYLVNGAGWSPLYNADVDTSNDSITFDIYTNITQSTGENWENVTMEISTAKSVSAKFSDVSPWYVDIYKPSQPVFYKEMRASKALIPEEIEDKLAGVDSNEPAVKEEGISFSFILRDTVTVPSDNQPHKVFIASKKITKNNLKEKLIKYVAIPKKSPYVFLTGLFNNPFEFPLFAGKVNIFVDGKFLNTQNLSSTKAPAEQIQLPLGVDESLKVERKRLKKFTEYSGIVSKSEKIFFEYEIDIQNGKSKEVGIEVKDSYPISLNEQIKTHLETPTDKDAAISKDGIIIWQVNIPAKSNRKLNLKFDIEYPKELKISGIE
ncbi:mucoidy inhibitor MuiA family protein [Deferribacterales bacterium Es71-Z0220]|uniref:mucoidy inhibitor MuiA family protein n=1 Tax=Deferrivibrio essentukiensis TaxID=2880922 RepID=UPI001F6163E3|nr:mucoidy inhibitor MuiA family protein [Deferrivibrio essentukiensis]MCB4204610.1 mucoidy inhibitor MuiA family protein [Deferrivibrio essentukiensis]